MAQFQFEGNVAKMRVAFDRFDLNKNGRLTHDELRAALDDIGYCLSESDLQKFICEADADNSGEITFDEFKRTCSKQPTPQQNKAKLRRLFRSMDVDGSGFITLKDLRTMVHESGAEAMSEDQLKQIILKMDKNGDKKVSFEEFTAYMSGK